MLYSEVQKSELYLRSCCWHAFVFARYNGVRNCIKFRDDAHCSYWETFCLINIKWCIQLQAFIGFVSNFVSTCHISRENMSRAALQKAVYLRHELTNLQYPSTFGERLHNSTFSEESGSSAHAMFIIKLLEVSISFLQFEMK